MKLVSKIPIKQLETVYDICVEDSHHYILENGIVTHNSGLAYASDVTLILSKAKQKEGTEHVGAIITLTVDKSRYIVEGKKAKVTILFKKGISKYSYLLELGIELGLFIKDGKKLIYDGQEFKIKQVERKPETFYTKEILDKLRPLIKSYYGFATTESVEPDELEDFEDTENDSDE